MKAGQTLYSNDGTQVALFPLDYMYITQIASPGNYSHCCGNAMDCIGTYDVYPVYAPFDLHRTGGPSGQDNYTFYESDTEVVTPSGKSIVSFVIMHDNNVPSQTSFKQGELMAHTGTAGFVTGDHTHIEAALGSHNRLINSGITCSSGTTCYYLEGNVSPNLVFYVNDTTIVQSQGLNWQTYDGGTPEPEPQPSGKRKGMPIWMMLFPY